MANKKKKTLMQHLKKKTAKKGPPPPKQPLTGKQKEVLDWIVDFHKKNDIFPTNSEIAEEFDMSGGNVSHYLTQLVQRGHIITDPTMRPLIREII